jgi:hypothetical protein
MDEEDPKAESIMLRLWYGDNASKCDGHDAGYSCIQHLMTGKQKKMSMNASFIDIITNNFLPNFKVDYKFQFEYRTKSISFSFLKDFICGLIILIAFQFVNYQYLELFDKTQLKGTVEENKITIEENLVLYKSYNPLTLLLSFSLIL